MFVTLMAMIAVALTPASLSPRPKAQPIAFVGVTVLPMTATERLNDQTVLVRGDRIIAVGDRTKVRIPPRAKIIPGRGRTLMPGLVDMHVHLNNSAKEKGPAVERGLKLMLARGITTVRGTAGAAYHPQLRARVERGEIPGPRLYIGTQHINDQNTPDVATARRQVAAAKAAGFDAVKIHDITDAAVWQTLIDEAAKARLPTFGHVTDAVGLFRASAAGQEIEHLESVPRALLPPGSPALKEWFGQIPAAHLVAFLAKVSDADIARLAQRVKAAGGYHGPTLAFFERVWDARTPATKFLAEPGMEFMSRAQRKEWAKERSELITGPITPESGDTMRQLRRRIVRAFHQAGVPIFAGSASPQVYQPYGIGLFREIEAFATVGFTPMDALRSATVVPRDYLRSLPNQGSALGWKADFGTIEAGARADLLLLDGDPSRNVKALRRTRAVVAGGRLYEYDALQVLLRDAAPPDK